MPALFNNAWVMDVETFSNCFTLVARELDSKNYKKFVIHESRDDSEALVEWLGTRPILIGFNNLSFDGQIIEKIWRQDGKITAEEIYDFAQETIDRSNVDQFDLTYSEWDFYTKHVDLMRINHYSGGARATSLKWLEFTTRWGRMVDLPYNHTQKITKSGITKILSYNTNDVNITYEFYYICEPAIKLRKDLAIQYKNRKMINMSDSGLGHAIFKNMLSKNVESKLLRRGGSPRKIIDVKECLLNYIRFDSPAFQEVLDYYNEMTINVAEKGLKGVIKQKCEFDGMEFDFGTGGLHACYTPGVYESDKEHRIYSIDAKSYYPWVSIANDFYPEHIGEIYCKVYRKVYELRQKYEKGTANNYAMKIVLNSAYGKSNSKYSFLYDPMHTLKITVNGQLLMSMLAENMSKVGRLLIVNTDGLEVLVHKSKVKELKERCAQWEALTGITLERNNYKKLVLKDVNNYIAIDFNDEPKRKGMFELYDDIKGGGDVTHGLHKNPSANIIPKALFDYFVKGIPVEETIYGCNNIHEFLYGIKKRNNFVYWVLRTDETGIIDVDRRDDRVLRYYISRDGGNLFKHFEDGRKDNIIGVNRGQLITLALTIKDPEIIGKVKSGKKKDQPLTEYENLNREHYVMEAQKVIEEITAHDLVHA